ncbi:PREDICTED: lipase 3-like [Cyphomyrmex costatus]|uniref:lipase 3-like n=1 Tax=Cyphomyrmex costatus TaxID=456900 RepID=UPI0008522B54|nr:PREDICTED: lipase 3-like [Cyphomyrmex costatus]
MAIEMKFIFFILMLSVVLLEAKQTFWEDLALFPRAIIRYLFPKDPGIVRVRKLEEVETVKNVTTLDFIGLVERYGYPAEEHYVITKDHYILVIHRIPGSPLSKDRQRKGVIFLQHGLLASSDTWVLFGPGKNLAFLLADEGYDIWLGNYRGNTYCRSHIKLSPQDRNFWRFGYHEVGIRDLPAMIDYVLNYTKQKTLHYIGHSMGTTVLFTLLSTRPEYNAKIKLGICLAPVGVPKEMPAPFEFLRNLYDIPKLFKDFLDFNEINEIASLSSTTITIGRTLCTDKAITQPICVAIMFLLFGADPVQLNTTAFPHMLSHFPAGASVQLIYQYYQNFVKKKFQSYDHGHLENVIQYGQTTPIIYNLSKVTVPLAMYYTANDVLAPKVNVLETYKYLPNVILLEEISHKLFNHIDFLIAIDAKTLVYDRIIELFQKFDNN